MMYYYQNGHLFGILIDFDLTSLEVELAKTRPALALDAGELANWGQSEQIAMGIVADTA